VPALAGRGHARLRAKIGSSPQMTADGANESRGLLDRARPRVGAPSAESQLTRAAVAQTDQLMKPGPGRSLFVLTEVELGIGRPDMLLMAASPGALRARQARGLRLHNWTEARVLAAHLTNRETAGVTRSHALSVGRRLAERGWGGVRRVNSVHVESLLIEAKVADWKRGLRQLARTRRLAHRSALLVPRSLRHLIDRSVLTHGNIGLVTVDAGFRLRWERKGRARRLSPAADLWLTELAIRAMEDHQTPSAALKPLNPSRIARRRGR
jgi:hypothetical protein